MHEGLAWLAESPDGSEWLERLPDMLTDCAARWSLELGEPFDQAFESLAVPARRSDGSAAVLKLAFRGRENEHEGAALAHWGGDGAAALLEYDELRTARSLGRSMPSTPLSVQPLVPVLDVYVDL